MPNEEEVPTDDDISNEVPSDDRDEVADMDEPEVDVPNEDEVPTDDDVPSDDEEGFKSVLEVEVPSLEVPWDDVDDAEVPSDDVDVPSDDVDVPSDVPSEEVPTDERDE